jgi:hypothetical protein
MPSALSKDRSSLCFFSSADGRRCRTPRTASHPHLCTFHARKEAQTRASKQIGREISSYFSGPYLSAYDLSSALGHLFSAVAQGHIKPRSASILAYLSQTLIQSIHLAEHEYINAFGPDSWRRMIRSTFAPPSAGSPSPPSAAPPSAASPSAASPSPQPNPATAPAPPKSAPNSQQIASSSQPKLQPASPAESTLANLPQNKQLQPSPE